ncbi:MAG TPA: substrate-binding domain-containing protein [Anaeromyxobacter sp.]|nr:substrate-binding domain-containing protein [Anaeromyxobacter sp.]
MARRLCIILGAALFLVTACSRQAGPAAGSGNKKIKIGMANLSLCCAYFIGMSKAVEEEAKPYGNVEVVVTNADGKIDKLTADVEDLIAKKVDGVVLSAAWIEAAPAALEALAKAHIPVVMVDRKLKGGEYTSWIGPDNYAIGQGIGEYLVKQLGGKGKLAIIRGGPADNSIGLDRTNGVKSKVEGSGIEMVVFPDWGGWSTDGGKKAMEDLMAKNPNLNAVFCENDSMCLGAKSAVADAGKKDQIIVAAVDGQKEALKEILDNTNYVATGLNNSDQIGRAGFNRLMAILAGAQTQKDTVLPSPIINKENVVKFYNPNSIF